MDIHPAAADRKCNLVPQTYDKRDYADPDANVHSLRAVALPAVVSLRASMPPALDQGSLGSCTANVMANLLRYKLGTSTVPSRLYIYYAARVLMDRSLPNVDSGTTIKSACNAVRRWFACPEDAYPYTGDFRQFPSDAAFAAANMVSSLTFYPAPKTEDGLKSTLASGNPIACGVKLYSSFMSETVGQTGFVPMPDTMNDSVVGGHAMLITGYDSNKKLVEVLNSWGTGWGQDGYCYFPYAYVASNDLVFDMWKVTVA